VFPIWEIGKSLGGLRYRLYKNKSQRELFDIVLLIPVGKKFFSMQNILAPKMTYIHKYLVFIVFLLLWSLLFGSKAKFYATGYSVPT